MDPSNHSVLYLGTGEGFFNSDALNGTGIFRSVDSGASWVQLPGTADWTATTKIVVSPLDSAVVLAAATGGIYRSTDAGASWGLVSESSWMGMDLAIDPNSPSNLVASLASLDDEVGDFVHRVIRSTDGGATWFAAGAPLSARFGFESRVSLAYAASAPGWVYAFAGPLGAVFRSTDGGATWTARGELSFEGQLWYNNTIWVDPTNASTLIVGAVRPYRSVNGGSSFTQISFGVWDFPNRPHSDVHCIVPDPGFNGVTNKRVWVCTDGGVYRTDNIYTVTTDSGWVHRNASYATAQYYHASGSSASSILVGGTQDNGTLRLAGLSTTAGQTAGADGGTTAIDPIDDRYVYGHQQALITVFRSTNWGDVTEDAIYYGSDYEYGNWVSPLALDPSNPNRLLVGAHSLWRTTNARTGSPPSWQAIRLPGESQLLAVAIAPTNPDIIWVAENYGRIDRTTNGTLASPTWTAVYSWQDWGGLPYFKYPTQLLVDPNDAETTYVAFGGYEEGNLWRVQGAGTSWTDISGEGPAALPAAPIRAIARHPERSDWLFVGTEVGVFASYDAGASWTTTSQGPRNVAIDSLNFVQGSTTLLAATHGRGLWTIDLPNDIALSPGQPIAGQITSSEPQGVWRYYYVDIGLADSHLSVLLSNLTGDLDLYVRHGELPSLSDWNCRPHLGGNSAEQCTVEFPQEGRWWIGILNTAIGTHSFQVTANWESCLFWDNFESGGLSRWSDHSP